METQNDSLIEITQTLEQIKSVNEMLAFHRHFDEPDMNAIHNFQRLKNSFLLQLASLLEAFEIEVKLPVVA